MNPLWLILIIPLSMIAGVVLLIVALALTEEPPKQKKCKNCPHFGSYGITPSAYAHYEQDNFWYMSHPEYEKRFDGEVGICKKPGYIDTMVVSEDCCCRNR